MVGKWVKVIDRFGRLPIDPMLPNELRSEIGHCIFFKDRLIIKSGVTDWKSFGNQSVPIKMFSENGIFRHSSPNSYFSHKTLLHSPLNSLALPSVPPPHRQQHSTNDTSPTDNNTNKFSSSFSHLFSSSFPPFLCSSCLPSLTSFPFFGSYSLSHPLHRCRPPHRRHPAMPSIAP